MVDMHPIPDSRIPGITPKASVSNTETQTFGDQAEAFYSWYQSIRQLNFPVKGYHSLQYIMNISKQGTATKEEGIFAAQRLNQLIEEIDGGVQTLDHIPYEIEKIADGLTNHNPNNRIVMQVTKIQIAVTSEDIQQMMDLILTKIAQHTPHITAEKISRILQDAIDHLEESSEKSLDYLQQKISHDVLPLLDK